MSPIRTLVKRWHTAPKLKSPVGKTIVLAYEPAAAQMDTGRARGELPALEIRDQRQPLPTTLIYGPTNVQGTQYAFPNVLAPGTYYWAVQPIDAAGNLGTQFEGCADVHLDMAVADDVVRERRLPRLHI